MARPLKMGIDYYPTDVDIDQDDKVVMVKNKFGLMGMGTVSMLLARIYKTGYYYHWTEREQELFAGHFREDINVINNVVNECIKWGFFDKNKFEQYEILTSIGIQKRYLLAVERRKDKHINNDYWLLEKEEKKDGPEKEEKQDDDNTKQVNEDINLVNVDNNPVNASKSTQSKVNRKEINKHIADSDECDIEFEEFWELYPNKKGKVDAVKKWKSYRKKKQINFEKVIQGTKDYIAYLAHEKARGFNRQLKDGSTFVSGKHWETDWLASISIAQNGTGHTEDKKDDYSMTREEFEKMMMSEKVKVI